MKPSIHQCWQVRLLRIARDHMYAAVLSVLAHSEADMFDLYAKAACWPNPWPGAVPPLFASCAKVLADGKIGVDIIDRQHQRYRNAPMFRDLDELTGEFRRLADQLKLTDADRLAMFAAVQKWIVADHRLNPLTGDKDKTA
jgi:hypothetical protein